MGIEKAAKMSRINRVWGPRAMSCPAFLAIGSPLAPERAHRPARGAAEVGSNGVIVGATDGEISIVNALEVSPSTYLSSSVLF